MTSPATTTAAPTLPPNFLGEPGCLGKSDFWVWSYDGPGMDARTVLGGPSQTAICLPTAGDPTGTYAATQCPPQYTPACTNTAVENGAVTCCPKAHDFSCIDKPLTAPHADFFRCSSQWGTSATQVLMVTDMVKNTLRQQTVQQRSSQHLFAVAMVYQTMTGTQVQPVESSSSTANSDSSSEPGGLSTGASAGIGVGVAVGVLLIAAIAFCLFWRRRKRTKGAQAQAELAASQSQQGPSHMNAAATPTTAGQNENYGYWDSNNHHYSGNNMKTMAGDGSTIHTAPSPGPPPMAEMAPGTMAEMAPGTMPHEMDGNPHARAEMPGH